MSPVDELLHTLLDGVTAARFFRAAMVSEHAREGEAAINNVLARLRKVLDEHFRAEPVHVGTWVLAVDEMRDIVHWGADGETGMPYPPDDKDALAQAEFLWEPDSPVWLMRVFDNGQVKTFEFEPAEAT